MKFEDIQFTIIYCTRKENILIKKKERGMKLLFCRVDEKLVVDSNMGNQKKEAQLLFWRVAKKPALPFCLGFEQSWQSQFSLWSKKNNTIKSPISNSGQLTGYSTKQASEIEAFEIYGSHTTSSSKWKKNWRHSSELFVTFPQCVLLVFTCEVSGK